MRVLIALCVVLLAGCGALPHTVETRLVAGNPIEIHTDAPESLWPSEKVCQRPWAGCSDVAGRRIFLRSPVVEEDVEHELDHHRGLVHGLWVDYGGYLGVCAYVYVSGQRYKSNTVICKTSNGERIYGGTEFFNIVGSPT